MEIQTRTDFFEPGDQTALVCIDVPEIQKPVVDQLAALNYKMHTGLFAEDVSLKMKAQAYDVVVIYENFNDTEFDSNPLMKDLIRLPAASRRKQYAVLVGPNMITNNDMQAFMLSVDLVFSVSDLANFKPVLRRGITRHQDFVRPFMDCLKMIGD